MLASQCFSIYFDIFISLQNCFTLFAHVINEETWSKCGNAEWDISQISQDVERAVIKGCKTK